MKLRELSQRNIFERHPDWEMMSCQHPENPLHPPSHSFFCLFPIFECYLSGIMLLCWLFIHILFARLLTGCQSLETHSLSHCRLSQHCGHTGSIILCGGAVNVHCRMVSSSPGLYSLLPVALRSYDNQNRHSEYPWRVTVPTHSWDSLLCRIPLYQLGHLSFWSHIWVASVLQIMLLQNSGTCCGKHAYFPVWGHQLEMEVWDQWKCMSLNSSSLCWAVPKVVVPGVNFTSSMNACCYRSPPSASQLG